MNSSPMGLLDDLDRRLTNLEGMLTAPSNQPGNIVVPPVAGGGGQPVIIAQGVSPPTQVILKPGAFNGNVYIDITWVAPIDGTAVAFEVNWVASNPDGSLGLLGAARVGGNSFRLNNLLPNTRYNISVTSLNILGQMARFPSAPGTFVFISTGNDNTIPPAVSNIVLALGATSVIIKFDPLTFAQAPDVGLAGGLYQIDLSNDPAFGTIFKTVRTAAFVVAFNDIYPHSIIRDRIAISDGAGTSVKIQPQDVSGFPTGAFSAYVDQELISFNALSGNAATIIARNTGANSLGSGPVVHDPSAPIVAKTSVTWYARVAAIDSSGNQGPWAFSATAISGQGITDAMIVGDLSASHITFGTMKGTLIETNTLQANAISTSLLTAANITLQGGSFIAGTPPDTGLVINSQGLRVYSSGVLQISLDAPTGVSTFYGLLSGNTIVGANISGGVITGSTLQTSGSDFISIYGTVNARIVINEPTVVTYGPFTGGIEMWGNTIPTQIIPSRLTGYPAGGAGAAFSGAGADAKANATTWTATGLGSNTEYITMYGTGIDFIYQPFFGTGYPFAYFLVNAQIFGYALQISGTKSFTIDHPLVPELSLSHVCIESPNVELIYRGKVSLKNGVSTVDIDAVSRMTKGTFEAITRNGSAQVFLFNETGASRVSGELDGAILTIHGQSPSDTVGWLVIAERQDEALKSVLMETTDNTGRFIVEKSHVRHHGKILPHSDYVIPETDYFHENKINERKQRDARLILANQKGR